MSKRTLYSFATALILALAPLPVGAGQSAAEQAPQQAAPSAPSPATDAAPSQGAAGRTMDDEIIATRGRYRIQPGDVFELRYRYSPEFNETITVQPDGFVMLQIAGELKASGLTVAELTQAIVERSRERLRDPVVTITLKEFEKPHFVVTGEVKQAGRYDLKGHVTVLEAVALAGGLTHDARHSQALLVRRIDNELAHVQPIDLKKLMKKPSAGDEYVVRSGDLIIVPQNTVSKVDRIVKWTTLGSLGLLF
ncbi:MAG TPA: polysaccharide biosynthesis/export family protein [Vicinamibacterales bacterium]